MDKLFPLEEDVKCDDCLKYSTLPVGVWMMRCPHCSNEEPLLRFPPKFLRYFKLDCCGPKHYYIPVPSELEVYDCPLCLQPHEIIHSLHFVNGRYAFKSKAAVGTEKRFPPVQQALISMYEYKMTGPERERKLEMEMKKLTEEMEKAKMKEDEMRQIFIRGTEQILHFLEERPKMDEAEKKYRVVALKEHLQAGFWGQNARIKELEEEKQKLTDELARVRRSMVKLREDMDKLDWRLYKEREKNEALEMRKNNEVKEYSYMKRNNEPRESSQDVRKLEEDLARERKVKEQFVVTLKGQMAKTKELRRVNEEQNNEMKRVMEEVNELKMELGKIAEQNSQLQADLTNELKKNDKVQEERPKGLEPADEQEQNKENKKDTLELNMEDKRDKEVVTELEELKQEKIRLEMANKEKDELIKFFMAEHKKISSAVHQVVQGIDEKKKEEMSTSEEQSAA